MKAVQLKQEDAPLKPTGKKPWDAERFRAIVLQLQAAKTPEERARLTDAAVEAFYAE